MTFFASQNRVPTQQWKAGNVMVELHFGKPAIDVVAIVAFFTLLAVVGVLVPVAAIAFHRNFFVEPVGMAFLAANVFMFAQ